MTLVCSGFFPFNVVVLSLSYRGFGLAGTCMWGVRGVCKRAIGVRYVYSHVSVRYAYYGQGLGLVGGFALWGKFLGVCVVHWLLVR